MLRQINQRAIVFFVLAIGALMILASGISNILFVPESIALIAPTDEQPIPALGTLRLPGNEWIFLIFFVLCILAIISLMLLPEGRIWLMRLMLLIAAIYVLSKVFLPGIQTETLKVIDTNTAKPSDRIEFQPLITPPPAISSNLQTPAWLVTVAGIGLALLIVFGIAAIFWLIAHLNTSTSVPKEISQEAQAAAEALEAGGDFQDVILRCYARMSQVLSEQRGVFRESAMTPHEFERVLIKLGFPSEPVRTLTHLFEEVRYGCIQQGENGIQMAVSSLNAIIYFCKSVEPI